jgi:hypothetical protein
VSVPGPDRGRLEPEIGAALERLDQLIEAFESDPDEGIQEMTIELLQSVDTIHRTGVTRLAALLAEAGEPFRQRALADPAVRLLLELYDLVQDEADGFIPLEALEGPAQERA